MGVVKRSEGSVTYKTIQEDNETDVKKVAIWTIPDFMKFVEDKDIDEVHSPAQEFAFATNFDRQNQRVSIYYKSVSEQLCLKSVEVKTLTFAMNEWEFKEEHSIAREDRLIVAGGKWKLLTCHMEIDRSEGLCVPNIKEENKVIFLKNRSLRLTFEFVITCMKTKPDNWNIPTTQLNDIFKNSFLEGTFSDVVMKSSDGQEFKVHKVLLAGHSAVLKANFDNNFTESATNIVESPLESDVLHEMLLFMYTDQAKIDEMPEKLLAAADYYQLSRLKSLCEQALYKKLSVDNAIEILQLADLYSTELLTELTLDFIKQDSEQLKLIKKTDGWAKLDSIDLLKRIC